MRSNYQLLFNEDFVDWKRFSASGTKRGVYKEVNKLEMCSYTLHQIHCGYHTWFLEIAFVCNVGMHVCVHVCMHV